MTIMQQLSTRGATAEQGPVVSAVRPPACGAVQNTLRNLCKYFAQSRLATLYLQHRDSGEGH